MDFDEFLFYSRLLGAAVGLAIFFWGLTFLVPTVTR